MAKTRDAAQLAEFVKFKRIGMRVLGRITDYRENENGPFVIMSPALVREPGAKEAQRFAEVAVGLSKDLQRKVTPQDKGKMMAVAFVATSPSERGNDFKHFAVVELETGVDDPWQTILNDGLFPAPASADQKAVKEDDDLPF